MYESFMGTLVSYLKKEKKYKIKNNKRWFEYLYWFLYKYLKSKNITNKDLLLHRYKQYYLDWKTPLVNIDTNRDYIDKEKQVYSYEKYKIKLNKEIQDKINAKRIELNENLII